MRFRKMWWVLSLVLSPSVWAQKGPPRVPVNNLPICHDPITVYGKPDSTSASDLVSTSSKFVSARDSAEWFIGINHDATKFHLVYIPLRRPICESVEIEFAKASSGLVKTADAATVPASKKTSTPAVTLASKTPATKPGGPSATSRPREKTVRDSTSKQKLALTRSDTSNMCMQGHFTCFTYPDSTIVVVAKKYQGEVERLQREYAETKASAAVLAGTSLARADSVRKMLLDKRADSARFADSLAHVIAHADSIAKALVKVQDEQKAAEKHSADSIAQVNKARADSAEQAAQDTTKKKTASPQKSIPIKKETAPKKSAAPVPALVQAPAPVVHDTVHDTTKVIERSTVEKQPIYLTAPATSAPASNPPMPAYHEDHTLRNTLWIAGGTAVGVAAYCLISKDCGSKSESFSCSSVGALNACPLPEKSKVSLGLRFAVP